MSNIFERASYMRQPGENWQNAIQRASYSHNMEQTGGAKRGRPKDEKNAKLDGPARALARCRKKKAPCARQCIKSACETAPNCNWASGPSRQFCRKATSVRGKKPAKKGKSAKKPAKKVAAAHAALRANNEAMQANPHVHAAHQDGGWYDDDDEDDQDDQDEQDYQDYQNQNQQNQNQNQNRQNQNQQGGRPVSLNTAVDLLREYHNYY